MFMTAFFVKETKHANYIVSFLLHFMNTTVCLPFWVEQRPIKLYKLRCLEKIYAKSLYSNHAVKTPRAFLMFTHDIIACDGTL